MHALFSSHNRPHPIDGKQTFAGNLGVGPRLLRFSRWTRGRDGQVFDPPIGAPLSIGRESIVGIAVQPTLFGFRRGHHRMAACLRVTGGVAVG